MLQLLQKKFVTFKKLPRIVKHSCLVLPPFVGQLLFASKNLVHFGSGHRSELYTDTRFIKWEESILATLVRDFQDLDSTIKAWNDVREHLIEKEEGHSCLMQIPEPNIKKTLLGGIHKAAYSTCFLQKRHYRPTQKLLGAVSEARHVLEEDEESESEHKSFDGIDAFPEERKVMEALIGVDKGIDRVLRKCERLRKKIRQNPGAVAESFHWLKCTGFTDDEVLKFSKLLTIHPDHLIKRTGIIAKAFPEFSEIRMVAGVLSYGSSKLESMMNDWKEEGEALQIKSRVHWLASTLNVEFQHVFDNMWDKPFLHTLSMRLFQTKIQFLSDAGVDIKYLVNDLWILCHTEENLLGRLNRIRKIGIEPIKPWHLRCSMETLEKCAGLNIPVRRAEKVYPDVAVYYKKKLNIGDSEIEKLFAKMPQLRLHTLLPKIDALLTFLLDEGVSRDQIMNFPRVFEVRVEDMAQRVEILREHGFDMENVKPTHLYGRRALFKAVVVAQLSQVTPSPGFQFQRRKSFMTVPCEFRAEDLVS